MHKADQDYIDAYFLQRRAKEIRRMLIAVFALIAGGLCAGLAEPIVGFLNESPSLSISQMWCDKKVGNKIIKLVTNAVSV